MPADPSAPLHDLVCPEGIRDLVTEARRLFPHNPIAAGALLLGHCDETLVLARHLSAADDDVPGLAGALCQPTVLTLSHRSSLLLTASAALVRGTIDDVLADVPDDGHTP